VVRYAKLDSISNRGRADGGIQIIDTFSTKRRHGRVPILIIPNVALKRGSWKDSYIRKQKD